MSRAISVDTASDEIGLPRRSLDRGRSTRDRLSRGFHVPGLQGMSWTRVAWLIGACLGFAVFSLSGQIIRAGQWPWTGVRDLALDSAQWFVRYFFDFAPVLIMLTLADNLPFTGRMRTAALVLALVIGAQFQWLLLCVCMPGTESSCDDFPASLWRSWTELLGDNTVWAIAYSTPIALTYFYRRRDRDAAKALHDAEIARADLRQRALEAELHTMQARVEPSFLFDTLGEIGERYDREPGAGEQMLNELIDYLRAALPDISVPGSTLRQEAALARAFLAILAIRADGRLAVQVQIAEGLDELEVPPAILVPLLAAAVPCPSPIATASSVQLAAIVDGALVRVVITGRGASMRAVSDTQVVHDIRERLRSFYGEAATLDVHVEPARRLTIVLRLPRAHA